MKNTSLGFIRLLGSIRSLKSLLAALLALTTLLAPPLSGYAAGGLSSNTRLVDDPYEDSSTHDTETGIFGTKIKTDVTNDSDKYTDPDTGISFRIPSKWQQAEFNTSKDYLSLKLQRDDSALLIMYGAGDMYANMGVAATAFSRDEINMEFFSDEEIEDFIETIGGTGTVCVKETVGGREFLTFESHSTTEILGLSIDMTITYYYTVANGYLIYFQFTDSRESEYFPEFLSLLQSVETE